jgi:hypothetical protein
MPRRFSHLPDHLREPHEIEWQGFWRFYLIAMGIVLLLGLLTGSAWIAWRLLGARFGC